LHDIEVIQKELPVDLLEFFCLTPLPGSEDHRKLLDAGTWMDPDMNKYDVTHVTTAHQRMSREQWEQAYRMAWETYYSTEHIQTVLRRAAATGASPGKALFYMAWFKGCISIENIHPLEGGLLRLKSRRTRRSGLPLESAWLFYPKYLVETVRKQIQWLSLYTQLHLIYRKIKSDPQRYEYTDLSLTPATDEELETRELFQSKDAQAYVGRLRRLEKIRRGEAA
jgi:hypothetical protein